MGNDLAPKYLHVSIWMYPGKNVVCGYKRGALTPIAEFKSVDQAVAAALTVDRKRDPIAVHGPKVGGLV